MDAFACGGLAAAASICLVNPIDVVKSRLQMQGEMGSTKKLYTSPTQALAHIAKNEGLPGLYRGLPPAILFQVVGNASRFGIYHYGRTLVGTSDNSYLTNVGLALTSGALTGMIACPFFVLKTQVQVQTSVAELATGHQHAHSGTIVGATRHILATEGIRGLYRGVDAFTLRCLALVGAQMPSYDAAKHVLGTRVGLDGTYLHLASSFLAAGAACLCMQPFDLVSARLMNQPAGEKRLYCSPMDCFTKTLRAEGPAGLYKGVLANYMRMGPQYVLTFVFFERLKPLFKKYVQGESS